MLFVVNYSKSVAPIAMPLFMTGQSALFAATLTFLSLDEVSANFGIMCV